MSTELLQAGNSHVSASKSDPVGARRRTDRYFFAGMALLILGSVFLGFAKTYFLAGVFNAPLPSWIIHVHGGAFSSWILFLLLQTLLVSSGRVDLHRKLGLAGFGLACV